MRISIIYIFLLAMILSLSISCNKQPATPDFYNIGAYVIGKEICNADESKDYWLLDCTVYPNTPQVGDTLFFSGTKYTNVIKTKDLGDPLKIVGTKVTIDYKVITPDYVESNACDIPSPKTYKLKEIFIITQGFIR